MAQTQARRQTRLLISAGGCKVDIEGTFVAGNMDSAAVSRESRTDPSISGLFAEWSDAVSRSRHPSPKLLTELIDNVRAAVDHLKTQGRRGAHALEEHDMANIWKFWNAVSKLDKIDVAAKAAEILVGITTTLKLPQKPEKVSTTPSSKVGAKSALPILAPPASHICSIVPEEVFRDIIRVLMFKCELDAQRHHFLALIFHLYNSVVHRRAMMRQQIGDAIAVFPDALRQHLPPARLGNVVPKMNTLAVVKSLARGVDGLITILIRIVRGFERPSSPPAANQALSLRDKSLLATLLPLHSINAMLNDVTPVFSVYQNRLTEILVEIYLATGKHPDVLQTSIGHILDTWPEQRLVNSSKEVWLPAVLPPPVKSLLTLLFLSCRSCYSTSWPL